tara:strand:- start:230 stop:415 length:186 start_codon:yes stop_codon:yes gene_type:complete
MERMGVCLEPAACFLNHTKEPINTKAKEFKPKFEKKEFENKEADNMDGKYNTVDADIAIDG